MRTTPQMLDHVISWMTTANDGYYEVEAEGVTAILQHPAQGEGDKWYYDVIYQNELVIRVFNAVTVGFSTKEPANGTQTDV